MAYHFHWTPKMVDEMEYYLIEFILLSLKYQTEKQNNQNG